MKRTPLARVGMSYHSGSRDRTSKTPQSYRASRQQYAWPQHAGSVLRAPTCRWRHPMRRTRGCWNDGDGFPAALTTRKHNERRKEGHHARLQSKQGRTRQNTRRNTRRRAWDWCAGRRQRCRSNGVAEGRGVSVRETAESRVYPLKYKKDEKRNKIRRWLSKLSGSGKWKIFV